MGFISYVIPVYTIRSFYLSILSFIHSFVTPGCRRGVNEMFVLPGCYAA